MMTMTMTFPRKYPTAFRVLAAASLLLVSAACVQRARAQDDSAPGGTSEAEPTWHEGVLKGGFVAIGGEHTGWILERDDDPDVMIDVGPVRERAKALEGQRVRAFGRIVQRDYVERGRIPVLEAEKLEPAG